MLGADAGGATVCKASTSTNVATIRDPTTRISTGIHGRLNSSINVAPLTAHRQVPNQVPARSA